MENEPYLVSLSHGYDETRDCLYFHCTNEGKETRVHESKQQGGGQAVLDYGVTDECDYAYTSVHFKGTISLIENLREKQHAIEVMVRQLSKNPEEKLAKIRPEKLAKTTMGRIDIEYMSGKTHQHPTL